MNPNSPLCPGSGDAGIYIDWCITKLSVMSCIENKKYSSNNIQTRAHSNIISTLSIHKQTSLNFDDKKYIICIGTDSQYQYHSIIGYSPMSGHQKIIALQLICTNTNCFYKIIIVKLLARDENLDSH